MWKLPFQSSDQIQVQLQRYSFEVHTWKYLDNRQVLYLPLIHLISQSPIIFYYNLAVFSLDLVAACTFTFRRLRFMSTNLEFTPSNFSHSFLRFFKVNLIRPLKLENIWYQMRRDKGLTMALTNKGFVHLFLSVAGQPATCSLYDVDFYVKAEQLVLSLLHISILCDQTTGQFRQ